MEREDLRNLLEEVSSGRLSIDEAVERLKDLPFVDLGFAKVDTHRSLRRGVPEVVFGEGKTVEQILEIASAFVSASGRVIITRVDKDAFESVARRFPEAEYHPSARVVTVGRPQERRTLGKVLVVSAGTSDLPVAEEARVCAWMMGNPVETLYDAGVAGLHRLAAHMDKLREASVIVCCAGMEGALPGVVAALTSAPVIGVPVSVGYGVSRGGFAALLSMLSSCSGGVVVVNIDNGFGAAYAATLMNTDRSGDDPPS